MAYPNILSSFYHTIKSNVRHCLMHCLFCMYILKLVFLLQNTIFFMLIHFKNTCWNHSIYDCVFLFFLSIGIWFTTTSSLHVNAELIKNKVSNICWFFQGAFLIDYHASAWGFSLFNSFRISWITMTGNILYVIKYPYSSIFFTHYSDHGS